MKKGRKASKSERKEDKWKKKKKNLFGKSFLKYFLCFLDFFKLLIVFILMSLDHE